MSSYNDRVYDDGQIQVWQGDCLRVLSGMDDQSVHSVVTDPPGAIGFMGREWDSDRGGRDQWVAWLTARLAQANRVLKPGGHGLIWAFPRTSHWTALAIEEAGFEVRECITHIFGIGFPKNLNIGKAIDKAAGAEREVTRVPTRRGNSERHGRGTQGSTYGDNHGGFTTISKPITGDAIRWNGWGTALKQLSEHWWLCRKPLDGTTASNVVKHGAGGINIATSLVPTRANDRSVDRWPPNVVLSHGMHHDGEYVIGDACADGCSSGCAVTELDRQSGKVGASKFFPVFRWDGRSVASDRQSTEGRSHPTVKSVSLTDWMVSLITPEGGTVLDMFAGTGPVASVARRREYQSILIDEDPESIGYILARLGEPVWGGPISGGLVQGDLFGEEVP